MIDPQLVATEFMNMKVKLVELLQQCNPMPIVDKCGALLASDTYGIPLFPSDFIEMLKKVENTPKLIQNLSTHIT